MKIMYRPRLFLSLTVIALLTASSGHLTAAKIPYLENFDFYDNTINPGVMPSGFNWSGNWSVQDDGGGNDLEHANTDVNNTPSTANLSYLFATVEITNIVGVDFVMSAEMTIESATTIGDTRNDIEAGITCLGSDPFSGYKGAVDLANSGIRTISLQENGTTRASTLFPTPLVAGTTYTLTIRGTYSGPSSLSLVFSMTDGVSTSSVSFVDPSPLTGKRFGFSDILFTFPGGTTATIDVDYDELSILPASTPDVSLEAPRIEGNEFKFQFTAQTGRVYRVESRESLTSGDWTPVGSDVQAVESLIQVSNPVGVSTQRFYRAVLLP